MYQIPDHQMLTLWVTLVVNILLIAHLNPNIGGNLLRVLASGMTTSSSNLESLLFLKEEPGSKSKSNKDLIEILILIFKLLL